MLEKSHCFPVYLLWHLYCVDRLSCFLPSFSTFRATFQGALKRRAFPIFYLWFAESQNSVKEAVVRATCRGEASTRETLWAGRVMSQYGGHIFAHAQTGFDSPHPLGSTEAGILSEHRTRNNPGVSLSVTPKQTEKQRVSMMQTPVAQGGCFGVIFQNLLACSLILVLGEIPPGSTSQQRKGSSELPSP